MGNLRMDHSFWLELVSTNKLDWYKQNREPPHSTLPNSGKACGCKMDIEFNLHGGNIGKSCSSVFFLHPSCSRDTAIDRRWSFPQMSIVSIVVATFRPQIWVDSLTMLKNMSSSFLLKKQPFHCFWLLLQLGNPEKHQPSFPSMLNPHPKLRHWEYILLKVQQKINRISWIIAVLFFGHLSGEFGHRSHCNSRNSTPHGRLCPRKPYRSCSSGFSRRWRWQSSPNEFKHSSQPESFINRVIMGINIVLNACITSNRALVFCFDPSNPVQRFVWEHLLTLRTHR